MPKSLKHFPHLEDRNTNAHPIDLLGLNDIMYVKYLSQYLTFRNVLHIITGSGMMPRSVEQGLGGPTALGCHIRSYEGMVAYEYAYPSASPFLSFLITS